MAGMVVFGGQPERLKQHRIVFLLRFLCYFPFSILMLVLVVFISFNSTRFNMHICHRCDVQTLYIEKKIGKKQENNKFSFMVENNGLEF
jgi:hypothetical protein